jgi:hypothetical protein
MRQVIVARGKETSKQKKKVKGKEKKKGRLARVKERKDFARAARNKYLHGGN